MTTDLEHLHDLTDRACAGYPTAWWYPTAASHAAAGHPAGKGEARWREWVPEPAAERCAICPHRRTCLDLSLTLSDWADHGIWGGVSEAERCRIRARRRHTDALFDQLRAAS